MIASIQEQSAKSVLSNDSAPRDKHIQTIRLVPFDGSSAALDHIRLTHAGAYTVADDLTEQQRLILGLQLARIRELGIALLYVIKYDIKYAHHISAGVDRERVLLAKLPYELPGKAYMIEVILSDTAAMVATLKSGTVMPDPLEFGFDHALAHGINFLLQPPDLCFRNSRMRIDAQYATWSTGAGKKLVCGRTEWLKDHKDAGAATKTTPIIVQLGAGGRGN